MKGLFQKDIVLIGGGHTHALFCRMWAMEGYGSTNVGAKGSVSYPANPPHTRVTLITNTLSTPYSGMIPGLLSNYYTFDEAHIDLASLCNWTGVKLIYDEVVKVCPHEGYIERKNGSPIDYDILSINIGSRPGKILDNDMRQFTPIKPISNFLETIANQDNKVPAKILIVGAGASGVECALALASRYRSNASIVLISKEASPLPTFAPSAQKWALKWLSRSGIKIVCNAMVINLQETCIETTEGTFHYDICINATSAQSNHLAKHSGLPLDDRGFIKVTKTLQTEAFKNVFAVGDCASFADSAIARSGVYAVRQAKPLFRNIKALLNNTPLKDYEPQKSTLSLLGLSGQSVLASRGIMNVSHPQFWKVKESIDRRFMKLFFPPASMPKEANPHDTSESQIRCRGCGSKVGGVELSFVMMQLSDTYGNPDRVREPVFNPLEDLDFYDDASSLPSLAESSFVSVDYIPSMIDDQYTFGRIAALHAMSDIFAMGAKATFATVAVQVANSHPRIAQRALKAIMMGVLDEFSIHRVKLLAGHSSYAEEDGIALTVVGSTKSRSLKKSTAKSGDLVILTKPIGVGTILASRMKAPQHFRGDYYRGALTTMLLSNAKAAEVVVELANAATDVTGFGLGGHLLEIARSSQLTCRLFIEKVPTLSGFKELFESGVRPSIYEHNKELIASAVELGNSPHTDFVWGVLGDPQTSGGLLVTANSAVAATVIERLKASGYEYATVIGELTPQNGDPLLRIL